MKILIIVILFLAETLLGVVLFHSWKPHFTSFKNVDGFIFQNAAFLPISNSYNKSPNGYWFLFRSNGKEFAFESRRIVPSKKYCLSKKNINLNAENVTVCFCRGFNLVGFLAGRLFIMLLALVLLASFAGWFAQRWNLDTDKYRIKKSKA